MRVYQVSFEKGRQGAGPIIEVENFFERKNMSRKCVTRSVLFVALLFLVTGWASGQEIVLLTNLDTGGQISLRNVDGSTLVTNVETGESIVVKGEFAGKMTDEDYTDMLRRKDNVRQERILDGAGAGREVYRSSLVASGSYSVSGGTSGWETPLYYIQSTGVQVKIYGTCSRPGGDYVNVTLYKSVPWWYDTNYGTKSYYVDNDGETSTKNWPGVTSGQYYYLLINKSYNGYRATGTYTISG